jgi:PAS domain S-box-containing protein
MTVSGVGQHVETTAVGRGPIPAPRPASAGVPPAAPSMCASPLVVDRPGLGPLLTRLATNRIDQLTVAASLLSALALWALGRAHVVSPNPLWLWSITLLVALVATLAGQARWRTHPSNALAHGRIGVQVVVVTVLMYLTGWGPILGIGYIVIVGDLTTQMGSRHWRALAVWSVLGFTGGALAIAAGLAPTMLARPCVYGLAALAGAATVFAIVLLGITGEHAESAQQSLVESEGKLRRTIERANLAYIELDGPTGQIAEWNGQAEHTFGWSRDEAIGRRYGDLVFPASRRAEYDAIVERALDAAPSEARQRRTEQICLHRDGYEFPVELSSWPIETKDGLRLNIFLQDITARVTANEELQRSNDKFRLLFEQHPRPMWVYDLETLRFLEVNRGAVEHYGYSREEFLSMSISDLAAPSWLARRRAAFPLVNDGNCDPVL